MSAPKSSLLTVEKGEKQTNASHGKPIHLAIIPDGNRRWAKKWRLLPWKGHKKAIENFRTLTEWCRNDPRVAILTVWCFSTENWKRDPAEIRQLMRLLEDYLRREREELLKKHTRLIHSGRKDRIPTSLSRLLTDVATETAKETAFTLHLAVDYGGKDELIRALKRLQQGEDVSEETIREHLDHPELPDIDLILRTSGEMRTSNFFLWQSTYAEWIFTDKFFPDITTEDLEEALKTFEERTRRFGN